MKALLYLIKCFVVIMLVALVLAYVVPRIL